MIKKNFLFRIHEKLTYHIQKTLSGYIDGEEQIRRQVKHKHSDLL